MITRILALLLGCCSLCAAHAKDMHYLVFEVTASDQVQLLLQLQRPTTLAHAGVQREALGAPHKAGDGLLRLHARAYAGETLIHAERIELSRQARPPGLEAQAALHAGPLRLVGSAFALRLPFAADTLLLDSGTDLQRFDLRSAGPKGVLDPALAKARLSNAGAHGPASNRVDLLVVSEGYRDSEEALFHSRVDEFEAGFFRYRPLQEYRALFNVNRLFVPSAQSGADHPPYRADCTGAGCCADPAAQNDLYAPRFVDTAFDATFCLSPYIHRALGVDLGKLLAAASSAPDWDVIIVLVNDPVYGGLGYMPSADRSLPGIAIASAPASALRLATHELGHSLGLLGDEYQVEGLAAPYCSDRTSARPCLDNHTDQTDPNLLKWRTWLTPGLALPSPAGEGGVGLFEGVLNMPRGIYRPTDTACMMNGLFGRFCPVCAEALAATLFDGRFGHPRSGIDLIEPGSEQPDPALPVRMQRGQSQSFQVSVLAPEVTLERQWLLNGQPIAGAHSDALDLSLDELPAGNHQLELRVIDEGPYLRSPQARALAVHSRSWQLQLSEGGGQLSLCPALSGAWYNPATPGQGVFVDVSMNPALVFAGWFTWGSDGQRDWYTAQGPHSGEATAVALSITQTSGGRFDDPAPVENSPAGSAQLQFHDCASATLEYQFDDGRSGSVPLVRLLEAPAACLQSCWE